MKREHQLFLNANLNLQIFLGQLCLEAFWFSSVLNNTSPFFYHKSFYLLAFNPNECDFDKSLLKIWKLWKTNLELEKVKYLSKSGIPI